MRYTIHLKMSNDFLPMVNCEDLGQVALYISADETGLSFRVFDNVGNSWVPPEVVFLACVSSGRYKETTT